MLDKQITLQGKTLTRDSFGGETITYTDLDTIWANIRTVSGREFYLAKTVNSEHTFEITIRYRTDTSTLRRVKYLDRYFDIEFVIDREMSRIWLTLICIEVI